MKGADFLIASPANCGKSQPFILGETGFSFSAPNRPASIMDGWMNGEGLPAAARDVLEQDPQFADIVGLIGVPTGSHKHRRPASGWVLARAASGLVSISIRDAQDCDPTRLTEDAAFATEEAQRFAARSVVVLVQASTAEEAEFGRKTLQRSFETDLPELNRLYLSRHASFPVWLASLSY